MLNILPFDVTVILIESVFAVLGIIVVGLVSAYVNPNCQDDA